MKQLVPGRDTTLQTEMIRQQNNERLRRLFAQKANQVGPWVERHLEDVAQVGVHKGSNQCFNTETLYLSHVKQSAQHLDCVVMFVNNNHMQLT